MYLRKISVLVLSTAFVAQTVFAQTPLSPANQLFKEWNTAQASLKGKQLAEKLKETVAEYQERTKDMTDEERTLDIQDSMNRRHFSPYQISQVQKTAAQITDVAKSSMSDTEKQKALSSSGFRIYAANGALDSADRELIGLYLLALVVAGPALLALYIADAL